MSLFISKREFVILKRLIDGFFYFVSVKGKVFIQHWGAEMRESLDVTCKQVIMCLMIKQVLL